MKLKPRLITFDFGDTLVSSEPRYLTRIWMGLKELGVKSSRPEVERAYHLADWKVSKNQIRASEYSPERYQRNLGKALLDQLGVKIDREKLLKELAGWLMGFRPERVMVPGALPLLQELAQRGCQMGIISNNDGRTREKCRSVGIENYFSFILDSTREKMCKPDPKFFRKALKLAGARPEETVHIGDLWGSDVLGARKVGLWAIWIENAYVRPGKLDRVFRVKKIGQALKYIK